MWVGYYNVTLYILIFFHVETVYQQLTNLTLILFEMHFSLE